MSEDLTWCIRGCVTPCRCEECAVADQPVHAPAPREATDGYLCRSCADRLMQWIADVPDLYATLDPYEVPATEESGRATHPEVSGSPALVRLDVLALQDPSTSAGMIPYPGAEPIPWDGRVYIPGEMATWAQLIAEEHAVRGRFRTLTESCGLLQRWSRELVASPWVDECYDSVRDIVRLLHAAHGERRPKPIGRCIGLYERAGQIRECGATLYKPEPGAAIRCRSCGRRYAGIAALRALADATGAGESA